MLRGVKSIDELCVRVGLALTQFKLICRDQSTRQSILVPRTGMCTMRITRRNEAVVTVVRYVVLPYVEQALLLREF